MSEQVNMKMTGTSIRSTRPTPKRYVVRFDLNTCKVLDDVTSDGRLFPVFAAATEKALSPILYRAVLLIN